MNEPIKILCPTCNHDMEGLGDEVKDVDDDQMAVVICSQCGEISVCENNVMTVMTARQICGLRMEHAVQIQQQCARIVRKLRDEKQNEQSTSA